jgi:hypothetical protein
MVLSKGFLNTGFGTSEGAPTAVGADTKLNDDVEVWGLDASADGTGVALILVVEACDGNEKEGNLSVEGGAADGAADSFNDVVDGTGVELVV